MADFFEFKNTEMPLAAMPGFPGIGITTVDAEGEPEDIHIDEGELAEAQKQAAADSVDTYTHCFSTPFPYMGQTFGELRFDFGSLTGRDSLAIEKELQALGQVAIVPAFSGPYLVRMAAMACTENIGADAFEMMPLKDYNKIRNAARSFLLAAE